MSAAAQELALLEKVTTREPIARDLTPAEAARFRQRTSVERVNARLKDEFGARHIRYRRAAKIMAQLILACFRSPSISG